MSRYLLTAAAAFISLLNLTGCDNTRENAKSLNVPYDGIVGVWSVPAEILEAGQRSMEDYLMNHGGDIDYSELPRIESFDIVIQEDRIAMFNLLSSPIGAFEPCYIGFGTNLDYLTSTRYRLEVSLTDFMAALSIAMGGFFPGDTEQSEEGEGPFEPGDLVNAPGMVGITMDIDTIDAETLEIELVKIDSSAFQTRLPGGQQGQSDMQFIRNDTNLEQFSQLCQLPSGAFEATSTQLIMGVMQKIVENKRQ